MMFYTKSCQKNMLYTKKKLYTKTFAIEHQLMHIECSKFEDLLQNVLESIKI